MPFPLFRQMHLSTLEHPTRSIQPHPALSFLFVPQPPFKNPVSFFSFQKEAEPKVFWALNTPFHTHRSYTITSSIQNKTTFDSNRSPWTVCTSNGSTAFAALSRLTNGHFFPFQWWFDKHEYGENGDILTIGNRQAWSKVWFFSGQLQHTVETQSSHFIGWQREVSFSHYLLSSFVLR